MKQQLPKKNLLPLALAAGCALSAAAVVAEETRPPNIIHIMADDLGWRDLGSYGSEIFDTPHLDALAASGMLFTQAYSASPLCSPTRASALTGQSVARHHFSAPHGHIQDVRLDPQEQDRGHPALPMTVPQSLSRLPLDYVTISQILKDAGYRTGFMGKWHLGHDPHLPENFGFDVVWGGRGTPGPPRPFFFGPWPEEANFPPTEGNPNADDVMGDAAVRFIAENPDDQPFFMCLWLYNVHAPYQGVAEVIEGARATAEAGQYQRSAVMYSMVKSLDDNVGKVIAELERRGMRENTIVIFTSDNGGNMYDRTEGENPTSNHPLRAGKGNAYEGGVRVPLIVSWPGMVEAGSITDAINISYDFFPTALELAGLPAPEGWALDGRSFLPVLRGEPFERNPIYVHFPHTIFTTGNYANSFVRDGKWKLMQFYFMGPEQSHHYELYDLSIDPGETRNVATLYPAVTERLIADLQAHLSETQALQPRRQERFNPNFELQRFRVLHGGSLVAEMGDEVGMLAKGPGLVVSYRLPPNTSPGNTLEIDVRTNSAVSVTAGAANSGSAGLFGAPVGTVPDLRKHRVRLPLGQTISSGEIQLVIDLAQPGRVHLGNPVLTTVH